jgi:1-acyl-sn-glycerol-3-phosphate acyltransferase
VPRKGRFVLASNHFSNTDPAIVGAGLGYTRRVRFMAKVELFKPPFGWVMAYWGAFPVRRGEADLGAMLTAERILRQQMPLAMFPEGTRSRTGTMGTRLQPGTASIALRAGAPVLPCAITGTERLNNVKVFLTRPRVTVRFGPPIPVEQVKRPTPEQVSALTAEINTAIRALLPPAYGGTYTG